MIPKQTEFKSMEELEEDFDKSEYTMWALHFARFHYILKKIDACAEVVLGYNKTRDYEQVIDLYYSNLRSLYINIRPNMQDHTVADFDKLFAEAKRMREELLSEIIPEGMVEYPVGFIELLEYIHQRLLFAMYRYLNLGYPVYKHLSPASRVRKALLDED